MATGASTCDLAIILIDARHGVHDADAAAQLHRVAARHPARRRRHQQDGPRRLVARTSSSGSRTTTPTSPPGSSMGDVHFIPISALKGDNVVDAERRTCRGTRARRCCTSSRRCTSPRDRNLIDLRFPVQYVNRPNLDFRGFCGTVASGVVRQGDEVMVLPSGKTQPGEVDRDLRRRAGRRRSRRMAVTVTLEDEIDVSRGDMLVRPDNVPRVERHVRGDGGVDGRGADGARQAVPGQAGDQAGRPAR